MTTEVSGNNDATATAMDSIAADMTDAPAEAGETLMTGAEVQMEQPAVPSDAIGTGAAEAGKLAAQIEEGFFDKLDPELKENVSLQRYKTVNDLAKGYLNAESAIGKDKVIIPDRHATPEDWKAFYGKIGMPDRFEDYHLNMPEGVELADGRLTEIKRLGYENNMMPHQVEKILEYQQKKETELSEASTEQYNKELQEQTDSLKKEWGEKFNQNLSRIHKMTSNMSEALGEENVNNFLGQKVNGKPLGNHPVMIKFFDYFSNLMNLDDIDDGFMPNKMNPAELDQKINTIMVNREHPFHVKDHPNHGAAVKEMQSYFERQTPSQKKSVGDY